MLDDAKGERGGGRGALNDSNKVKKEGTMGWVYLRAIAAARQFVCQIATK